MSFTLQNLEDWKRKADALDQIASLIKENHWELEDPIHSRTSTSHEMFLKIRRIVWQSVRQ